MNIKALSLPHERELHPAPGAPSHPRRTCVVGQLQHGRARSSGWGVLQRVAGAVGGAHLGAAEAQLGAHLRVVHEGQEEQQLW